MCDNTGRQIAQLLLFIEKFRGYPCICKVKSKEYHNREMKERLFSTALHMQTVHQR
jgi:hypothetical protein